MFLQTALIYDLTKTNRKQKGSALLAVEDELRELIGRRDVEKQLLEQLNEIESIHNQFIHAITTYSPPSLLDSDDHPTLQTTTNDPKLEVVTRFLRGGVNTSFLDDSGYQPLHYAIQNGSDKLVTLLLEANADPTGFGSDIPPIMFGCKHGKFGGIKALLEFEEMGREEEEREVDVNMSGSDY